MNSIRNFCIISHVDHGKSTLADRFLELTGAVEKRKMRSQYLDRMDLEREKGITIKMQPVRMIYKMGGEECALNLIDTPGHADFSYEVSRALAAVEGAILLVDITKGVQAQTLANLVLAKKEDLVIIPAINKIDLGGDKDAVWEEIGRILGVGQENIFNISAKENIGISELLRAVIEKVPPPMVRDAAPLRALIFDSHFDSYKGVVAHVRIFDGKVRRQDKIKMLASGSEGEVMGLGYFSPDYWPQEELLSGQIGYIATGIKEPEKVRVGDTIILSSYSDGNLKPLPGYQEPVPVIFARILPKMQNDYEFLRESLKKLKLNDASLVFEPESSGVLGRGFRAGFLGLLHMEIVGERLKREYGLSCVFSSPSVAYKIKKRSGEELMVYNPAFLPPEGEIKEIREPWAKLDIIMPQKFLGAINNLLESRRVMYLGSEYLGADRLRLSYEAPLKEIISGFYDELKSVSQGYASMSYEVIDQRAADLRKLDILVAGEIEESFSQILPRQNLAREGRRVVERLKELLPRQLFAVPIQAVAEGRIMARETLPAFKKDVTGYLYGGDRTRKMKLWKKQKKGKRKLGERGKIDIPAEVFLKMIQRG